MLAIACWLSRESFMMDLFDHALLQLQRYLTCEIETVEKSNLEKGWLRRATTTTK